MAKDVIMPVLGMNQDVGVLVAWLAAEGDEVTEGEPLMEVETDKAVVAVDAPASGVLRDVSAAVGDEVPVGNVIAWIGTDGETRDASSEPTSEPAVEVAPERAAREPAATPEPDRPDAHSPRIAASPKARRTAEERGLDLSTLSGTGPHGAVIARDIPLESVQPELDAPKRVSGSEHVPSGAGSAVAMESSVLADGLQSWLDRLSRTHPGVQLESLMIKFIAQSLQLRLRDRELKQGEATVHVRAAVGGTAPGRWIADAARKNLAEIATELSSEIDASSRPAAEPGSLVSVHVSGGSAVRLRPTPDSRLEESMALGVGRIHDAVVPVNGVPEVRAQIAVSLAFDPGRVSFEVSADVFEDLLALIRDPRELALLF